MRADDDALSLRLGRAVCGVLWTVSRGRLLRADGERSTFVREDGRWFYLSGTSPG
jgi:hypothetical protein